MIITLILAENLILTQILLIINIMDKKLRKDKKERKKERKDKNQNSSSENQEFIFQTKQELSEEDIRQKTKDYNIKLDQVMNVTF